MARSCNSINRLLPVSYSNRAGAAAPPFAPRGRGKGSPPASCVAGRQPGWHSCRQAQTRTGGAIAARHALQMPSSRSTCMPQRQPSPGSVGPTPQRWMAGAGASMAQPAGQAKDHMRTPERDICRLLHVPLACWSTDTTKGRSGLTRLGQLEVQPGVGGNSAGVGPLKDHPCMGTPSGRAMQLAPGMRNCTTAVAHTRPWPRPRLATEFS